MLLCGMACCILALAACKTVAPAKVLRQAVMDCDTIALYQVSGHPTPPSEQKLGEVYLNGYAQSKRIPLTPSEMEAIRVALLAETTFDSAAVKSCPMVTQMLLDLRHKGKTEYMIALSPAPCGKAIFYKMDKQPKSAYMELTPGNTLEPLVFRK